MMAHSPGIAADVHDGAEMEHPIDGYGCADFISEGLAPLLETIVRCSYNGGTRLAVAHHLVENDGPKLADRQVANPIDHQERGGTEHGEAVLEAIGGTRLIKRCDQLGKSALDQRN